MAERANQNAKSNKDQPMAGIQNAFSGNQNNGGPNPQFNPMGSGFTPQPNPNSPNPNLPHFPPTLVSPTRAFQHKTKDFLLRVLNLAALGGNPAGGDVTSLNCQIGEMNTQLGIEERKGVCTERDVFKAETDLLQAEVSRLQTLNEELANRATTSTAAALSQHEDAEMANLSDAESVDIIIGNEAQPPSGLAPIMRGPVPPEDLPDVPHGEGTHHLRKGVDITTALEYIALARRVRAFDDSGVTTDGPWPAYRMCRDRYDQAVKKPVDQRNDSAKKDKGKGRKHTKKAKPSTGADQDPLSSATTRLEGLKAPTQSNPPEYWAQYHYSYPDNTGGIQRDSNNHVSVRSVQGHLLIAGRAPRMPRGTPATEWNRFLFLSTELFATPGLYASLIESTGLTVASEVMVERFLASDSQNAILDSVAAFYASQGVTILMGEDTAVFALEWITAFHSKDSLTTNEARAMRDRVETLVSGGMIPAGLDENVWIANGLVSRPSLPMPGTMFFPAPPPPTTSGGLPYGSPLHPTASSSNSAGASGSLPTTASAQSEVSPALAQPEVPTTLAQSKVPPTAPMEGISSS
ncbi:hypothetical protein BT96DRAFT_1001218 [Gymnopus androsaceus JB14]|uniref:Uncharacterized protein n=1 Tax=Gymnopus androsaceus JB14 TaxID=1447944 RepID=A0A6A4H027_9AGAR|nr:hypothetical protein BT96DRAFT_1001218 [Gymnopus androsaceus JB14]